MTDPRALVRDAGYVAVGFGVLAFQRAQVRRRELEKQLADAGALGAQLDRSIDDVQARIDTLVAEVRSRLPEQAIEAFDTAVETARDATGQLLDLVRPGAAA